MGDARSDLAQITLAVLFIAALIGASLWILQPFLPAVIWAATLVIATWPLMRKIQDRLWGSRTLAVAIMTLVLLLLFVVPLWLAISTIAYNSDRIVAWASSLASSEIPALSSRIARLPFIGEWASDLWKRLDEAGVRDLVQKIVPYAGTITHWFISAIGGFGLLLVQFLLTVVISAIMYAKGEVAAAAAVRFGVRLAGERGEQSVHLAAQAIRGVALGVVVTALAQSVVGGVGLVAAAVPFAPILCAIMFLLCLAQIGPAPVLVPAVVWMFGYDDPSRATILLICSVLAIGMDNVLRPILIRRGADLPLLLIFAGVIGGLIAFGLIGIFLGPTILGIGYTLLTVWINEVDTVGIEETSWRKKPAMIVKGSRAEEK